MRRLAYIFTARMFSADALSSDAWLCNHFEIAMTPTFHTYAIRVYGHIWSNGSHPKIKDTSTNSAEYRATASYHMNAMSTTFIWLATAACAAQSKEWRPHCRFEGLLLHSLGAGAIILSNE